jgi:RsmE family RNA methyltransferase
MYFYLKDITKGRVLMPDSSHFFSMRVNNNQKCFVCNQNGDVSEILITKIDKKNKQIDYQILNSKSYENTNEDVLIQGVTDKNYLDKLVELLPFTTYSKLILIDLNLSPKQNLNLERLNNILIRSTEQSQNPFKAKIEYLENFEDLLRTYSKNLAVLVTKLQLEKFALKNSTNNYSKNVLIGPEGGFSESEIAKLTTNNCNFINFSQIVYPSWLCGYVYNQTSK